jgi:hypothetical protein
MAAARTKDDTYLGARYRRLAPRLGKPKAIVAIEHPILTAAWHMLTDDIDYHDLGGDNFARLNPERAMRRIVRQANALPHLRRGRRFTRRTRLHYLDQATRPRPAGHDRADRSADQRDLLTDPRRHPPRRRPAYRLHRKGRRQRITPALSPTG